MDLGGKADTHIHTKYSGFSKYSFIPFPESIAEPKTMVQAAGKKGLDVVCITDHDSIEGAVQAKKQTLGNHQKVEVVIGEEISSRDGEILALFIEEFIKPNQSAEETIDLIHDQGGIAVAPHPFSVHCPCLGWKISQLDLDGIEIFNAIHREGFSNLVALKEGCVNGEAKMGGSDAHSPKMVGNGYTVFKGSTQDDLKKAIKKGETSYGGSPTPLRECVGWSIDVALESSKMIIRSMTRGENGDILNSKIDKIKPRNKVICFLGSFAYVAPPMPLIYGLVGDRILQRKGLKMWRKYKEAVQNRYK